MDYKEGVIVKNVPNLRFKEFSGEWEQKKLEDFCDFCGGGTPSKGNTEFWNGDIAWVSSSDINENNINHINITRYITADAVKNSATKICPSNSILIVSRVGIGKVALSPTEVCTSQDFTNITNTSSNKKYLAYVISERMKREAQQSQGTSIKGITSNEIKSMKFFIPEVKEQEKIASFLSLIEKKIELQTEKVEELKNYKKGIMQKIFSQELRFKDENGNEYPEWEEVSLHQIGGTYTGLSGKTKADFGFGHGRFVTYINVFNNTLAKQVAEQVNVSEKENQSLVLKGDLLFTTSSETPNEVGMVSCWNYEMQNLYLNSFCFGYRIHNQDSYLPIFLAYMLRSGEYRKKISILAQGSTRYNISKTELMKMKVQCPCMEEQQKIVALLLNLESKVEHEQNKLNEFIQYKKGLLQQMFI